MPKGLPRSLPRKKILYCIFAAPWARKQCARKQRKSASRYVPDRSQPYKSTSFELLYLSEGLPKPAAKKKFWTVFLLARGRGSSAESHLPPNFELHCAGSGPHQSTSFELLCPSEAFPKRAVANSFSPVNLHFLILRGSRVEQCRINAVCNPAGSQPQKSTWIELLWPSEALPRLAVANASEPS